MMKIVDALNQDDCVDYDSGIFDVVLFVTFMFLFVILVS